MIPNNFVYRVNLERIMNKILYVVGETYSSVITAVSFVTNVFYYRHKNRFLPLLWKYFLYQIKLVS
jgi:F0F1-type ATP synthase assembly protein I